MNRTFKNQKTYKGEGKLNKFLDMKSAVLVAIGLFIWFILYKTLGIFTPIVSNLIGITITLAMIVVYKFEIDEDNYNKLGGEKLYKLIFAMIYHTYKQHIYVNTIGEKL